MLRIAYIKNTLLALSAVLIMISCKKDSGGGGTTPPPVLPPVTPAFDINSINDTYASVAPFANYLEWGSHNVHDPAIIREGEYYYSYSTDVGYGIDVRPGLQIRKSKDLVQWTYVGWVFNSLPPQGNGFISQGGGTAFNSLWAPCVVKVGAEFRLYYSLSCALPRLSAIGLATATSPQGPWTEKGLVVTSVNNSAIQTNAIDPSVIVANNGEHWMVYGSAWDGIYSLKLNPATGLSLADGDKGKRIANRGFTAGKYNGNIEGADLIYNTSFEQILFVYRL